MTKRLVAICFMAVLLIGVGSLPVRAQDTEYTRTTLKGISAVIVLVAIEGSPDVAKGLGLTNEAIQTSIELRLRLAGMRILTPKEAILPGMAALYIDLSLMDYARAASIDLELQQDVRLERNGQLVIGVATWKTGSLFANPNSQFIRGKIEEQVDQFLNAWLSVNPKK